MCFLSAVCCLSVGSNFPSIFGFCHDSFLAVPVSLTASVPMLIEVDYCCGLPVCVSRATYRRHVCTCRLLIATMLLLTHLSSP